MVYFGIQIVREEQNRVGDQPVRAAAEGVRGGRLHGHTIQLNAVKPMTVVDETMNGDSACAEDGEQCAGVILGRRYVAGHRCNLLGGSRTIKRNLWITHDINFGRYRIWAMR